VKLAYLLSAYPMTSSTFIRREIEALERSGVPVQRYATRHWDQRLVEPLDIAERARTHYLLTGNVAGLLRAFFLELITHPAQLARGLRLWIRLCANKREVSARLAAYLLQACYFRRRAHREGIGHVHCHFATNATAIAMLARAMGGPSYSFTCHGPDEFVNADASSLRMKVEHARFVVAISHYSKVQLLRASGMAFMAKICIVRCGVDLREFDHQADFRDVDAAFVCVGRLCPQKAQVLIPRALASIRDEFPAVRVDFVGDGESRGDLERAIVECGVAENVALHGWQDGAAVKKLLAGSRALLLPSFAEGLPVVIMESFALGRPVLSTFIAGIPELLDEHCGWIFPAGSVDDLAEAMRSALRATPARLAEMGGEARTRVERWHDLAKNVASLQVHFAEALSDARASAGQRVGEAP